MHPTHHTHALPQVPHPFAQVLDNLAYLFAWRFLFTGAWCLLACHLSAWCPLFLRTGAWRFLFLRIGYAAHQQEGGCDQCQLCFHVGSPCSPRQKPGPLGCKVQGFSEPMLRAERQLNFFKGGTRATAADLLNELDIPS